MSKPQRKRREFHGAAKTPLYKVWHSMISRCENQQDGAYYCYGGRGIRVCDRWLNSFIAFSEDMGPRPSGGTIERNDNNRGYEPDNCRWMPRAEQQRNTRRTISAKTAQMIKNYPAGCTITGRVFGVTEAIVLRIRRGFGDDWRR